jgi:DNA-binding beta-propeller fold protein YncE
MKGYRRIAIALIVPVLLTVVARRSEIAAPQTPVQAADAQTAGRGGNPAAPAQASPEAGRGARGGAAGPTTELLRFMRVDKPDFGISVAQTFDASGKPAYETKPGDLLFFTNASVSYNSTADKPMVIVIDAKARKIVAVADIDMPSTPHGITLSPDARYIYIPSGPLAGGGGGRAAGFFGAFGAPTAVIDARTLKLAAFINTGGSTHHAQVYADKYILLDSFAGPVPIFLVDPATNRVVRAIPTGDFNGRPYIAFPSPDGKFLYVTVRPGINRDASGREIDGWLAKVDAETMQIVGTFPVGPGPVWTAITQDGKTGYVTLGPTNRLVKLDLETGRILGIAPTGRGPYGIRLSPDEKIAYVANKGEGGNGQKGATFAAIDATNMTIIREQLSCPDGLCQADHIVLSPDGKELWISNNMGSISIFDRATLKMLATIQTPKLGDPHGGTFVQVAADNRSAKVVADIGGPHGGVSPYTPPAAAAATTAEPSNAVSIVARAFRFSPNTLEVAPGQRITLDIQNQDDADHNLVAEDAGLSEVVLAGSQRRMVGWTAPSRPGTYRLVCTYHRGMEIVVTVK